MHRRVVKDVSWRPHPVPCKGGKASWHEGERVTWNDHDCRCSRPGWALWLLAFALLAVSLPADRLLGLLPAEVRPPPALAWLVLLVALCLLVLLLGWQVRRTPIGVVVGTRNVASLSMFQAIAWAVLVCSVLLAVGWWNPIGLDGGGSFGGDAPLQNAALQVGASAGTSAVAVGVIAHKRRQVLLPSQVVTEAKATVSTRPGEATGRLVEALAVPEPPEPPLPEPDKGAKVAAPKGPHPMSGYLAYVLAPDAEAGAAAARKRTEEIAERIRKMAARDPQRTRRALHDLLESVPSAEADRLVGSLGPRFGLDRVGVRAAVQKLAQANEFRILQRSREGTVFLRSCACQASLADMLEGDEITDQESKDPGKVQFVLLTLTGLVVFGAVIWFALSSGEFDQVRMPDVPDGLSTVLLFSGLGYLGSKAPPKVAQAVRG